MTGFFARRRRKHLREKPLPDNWRTILDSKLPYYALLSDEERQTLHGHVQILLAEKRFEGCDGFDITDETRVVIAGLASVPLLGLEADFLPALSSILVYPGAYVAPQAELDDSGVIAETDDVRIGESWDRGAMALSWQDIEHDLRAFNGENVVFHEFAHQIDDATGASEGSPEHLDPTQRAQWDEVFPREYDAFVQAVDRGLRTMIDPYAASEPAEFFAVLTEFFFERPRDLERRHPALYQVFQAFYRQDPGPRFR